MTQTNSSGPGFEKRGIDWGRVDWIVVLGIALMHVGAVAAAWHFSWSGLAVMAVFYILVTFGITLGLHRLLTHRSFKTPKWFEYTITAIACLAWQGGAIQWVGTHRLHHKHSDDELDPHSPKHGFTWAHILWCMHEEDHGERHSMDAAKDMQRDPVHMFLNKHFWIPQILLTFALYGLGVLAAGLGMAPTGTTWLGLSAAGVSWVLWGVCLRTVLVYHGTWFVNSAAHTWGYRNFETRDISTNNWWVAILSFGEGWHNNHHGQQRSASHGMRWFEFDVTYWAICLLSKIGLATDIVKPKISPNLKPQIAAELAAAQATREDHRIATEAVVAAVSRSANAISDAVHQAAHNAALKASVARSSAADKMEAAREAVAQVFASHGLAMG